MTATKRMTPAEYGRHLARQLPPITAKQAEAAAQILASVAREQQTETETAA